MKRSGDLAEKLPPRCSQPRDRMIVDKYTIRTANVQENVGPSDYRVQIAPLLHSDSYGVTCIPAD